MAHGSVEKGPEDDGVAGSRKLLNISTSHNDQRSFGYLEKVPDFQQVLIIE